MAKRQCAIKATVSIEGGWLNVWCEPELLDRIKAIEGVVHMNTAQNPWGYPVWVDSRYDLAEVAAEIEALA